MRRQIKSFARGVIVLMFFGVLSKILGAIYRIPLTSIITPEGMGLYQMVFPVYSLMLTISSSGLPSSIAKLISEANTKHQFKQSEKIMRISFLLLFCFSLFCSLIVVFGSGFFAKIQGNKDATICYLGLAPAIVFVGLISGFRGYFQGLQKMLPTAISGFVEQVFKLCFGLSFAILFSKKSIPFAVLGAMIGISLSELVACLFLFVCYVSHRKKQSLEKFSDLTIFSNKETAKSILSTSVFVTLGGLVVPFGMMLDSVIVVNILKKISFSTKTATTLFGLESGTVGSIVNMPVILSLSIATAILPDVCSKKAEGDLEGVKKSASKSLLLAVLISLPASFGCFSLALPIMKILYGKSLSVSEIEISAQILKMASVSIFFLALVQVSAGILQGISKAKVPAFSLLAGLGTKVILNLIIIRIPSINILGAEISNTVCYMVAFFINMSVIRKYGFLDVSPRIFALFFASLFVFFAEPLFKIFIDAKLGIYLAFCVSVIAIVMLYFFLVFLIFRNEFKKSSKNTL